MVVSAASGVSIGFNPRTINLQIPRQVKENWVNHALKTYTGEQARARVFLRRNLGREPNKSEVDGTKGDKSIKGRVTAAQIMEDFDSGKEVCLSFASEFLMSK